MCLWFVYKKDLNGSCEFCGDFEKNGRDKFL